MLLAYQLRQAIQAALAAGTNSLPDFEALAPAIANLLRIVKQIERFDHLKLRLQAAAGDAAAARCSLAAASASEETNV